MTFFSSRTRSAIKGVAALVAVAATTSCGGGGVKVFKGPINLHPCSIVTPADATEIFGGPVAPEMREYSLVNVFPKAEDCMYQSQASELANLDVWIWKDEDQELNSDDLGSDGKQKPIAGLGKQAFWWEGGPSSMSMAVLSDHGVVLSFSVALRGVSPEDLLKRSTPVMRRILPRLGKALPGKDPATGVSPPPVDLCAQVTRDDRVKALGVPGSQGLWMGVGGRYEAEWICAYWTARAVGASNDVINVVLTKVAPSKAEMIARQEGAKPIPRLGQYAYWSPPELSGENSGGTLAVLTARGRYLRIWVALNDAARQQPEAMRLATKLAAIL